MTALVHESPAYRLELSPDRRTRLSPHPTESCGLALRPLAALGTTWLDLAVAAPAGDLDFVQLIYDTRHGGFSLRLEYEVKKHVAGASEAPLLLLTPGVLARHGALGISVLHELLAPLYRAAKVKPDALVMTHTPNTGFVDVTDMIRLNDTVTNAPPVVPQMRHRAERAACPELRIYTGDWRIPTLREWRGYVEANPGLGVPFIYYAAASDAAREPFEHDDYAALRRTWEWGAS